MMIEFSFPVYIKQTFLSNGKGNCYRQVDITDLYINEEDMFAYKITNAPIELYVRVVNRNKKIVIKYFCVNSYGFISKDVKKKFRSLLKTDGL